MSIRNYKDLWKGNKYHGAMVSIDPGVNIGWAVWDWCPKLRHTFRSPIDAGVFKDPGGKRTFEERCDSVLEHFYTELHSRTGLYRALIEMPQLMEHRGAMVSARSGALVKLTMMVGRIHQLIHEMGMQVELVEVRDWKGQMSKKATDNCIARRFGEDFLSAHLSDHERDAIALGLWAKGHFQGQQADTLGGVE